MNAATGAAQHSASVLPSVDVQTLATAAIAGAFATLAFDLFGQWLSPTLGFAKLAPVPLANAVINTVAGAKLGAGYLAHVLTGVVFYSVAYFLIVRPLWRATVPAVPEVAVGALYGIALWAFALYGMAHLVAGQQPFLSFTGITWVALVGHALYGVVLVTVARMREAR